MRKTLFLVIALGAVYLAPGARADEPKELPKAAVKELKSLQGKWTVEKFLHSDRETIPDGVIVEFKDGTIDFDKSATGMVVDLDPATEPKCLDFKVSVGSGALKKGSTYESIYKLDGDTLSWAVYLGREKNRPATFDKPTDAKVMVMVLKRVKE